MPDAAYMPEVVNRATAVAPAFYRQRMKPSRCLSWTRTNALFMGDASREGLEMAPKLILQ